MYSWGVVPIYLSEVAPPAFRASFAGVAYQLGNMVSSAAAQIEARGGENIKLPGTDTPDYATVQGILIGCVIAWMMACLILGPENQGAHFEQAKVAIQRGAGKVVGKDLVEKPHAQGQHVENVTSGMHVEKARPAEIV